MHIRSGDMVKVTRGDDRGKQGTVLRAMPKKNRIIVEGINLVTKHMRRTQKNQKGGRIEKEAPIDASSVVLVTARENVSAKDKKKAKKKSS